MIRRLSYWFFISIFLALAGCQSGSFFGPAGLTAVPPAELVRRPIPLTFVQLNADPAAFQNQYVQLQGAYLELPVPDCYPYRGPLFVWSLADLATNVAQRLRVDAQGFEELIALAPEGTPITVEGLWRLYQGPLGCGKNAPREAVWYLEVLRIVAPNPFPGVLESPRVTPAPEEEGEIDITPLATPTVSPTPDPRLTPSPPLPATMTPGMTPTPDPLLTPSNTPTATGTPDPAATPTAGGTTEATPTPPLEEPPTATPEEGYPPPPSPTPTREGYP